jgi:hypothetical protein
MHVSISKLDITANRIPRVLIFLSAPTKILIQGESTNFTDANHHTDGILSSAFTIKRLFQFVPL